MFLNGPGSCKMLVRPSRSLVGFLQMVKSVDGLLSCSFFIDLS